MGSGGSVHEHPASAVNLRFSVDPKNRRVSILSPVNEKSDSVNNGNRTVGDVLLKSHFSPSRFVDSGSKEDSFFDSQPWLESDCEDDFVSTVNGVNNSCLSAFSMINIALPNFQFSERKKRTSSAWKDG